MSNVHSAISTLFLLTLAPACQFSASWETDSIDGCDACEKDSWDNFRGSSGTEDSPEPEHAPEPESLPDNPECFGTGPAVVNLGKAADYAVLAKSSVSTISTSEVTGNLGLSPSPSSSITGFSLTLAGWNNYATSLQVIGNVYAADYKPPTPDNLAAAIVGMELAFTDAAKRWPDVTGLGGGDIGGMTLSPGVYNWDGDVVIPTDIGLHGCETDVWIFQVGGDLSVSSKVTTNLIGGVDPSNVFWQVRGLVDIGPAAHLEGIVLTQEAATLHMGASVNGRVLAQAEVTLASSTVTQPN